jgi:sphingolipid delta-4 desaturase
MLLERLFLRESLEVLMLPVYTTDRTSTFQLLFYALRPGFIRSQTPTIWHGINFAVVLAFDYLLVHFFGWKPLVYLLMSSFLAGSLHPCAAHFIAEHYLMNDVTAEPGSTLALAQETTSYYGWLNILCYNVSCRRRCISSSSKLIT